jgi:hypothetical protein
MAVCASAPAAFLCVLVFATQERKKERKDGSFLRFTRGNAPCALKKKNGFCALKTKHFHVQNQVVKLVRVEMLTQIL